MIRSKEELREYLHLDKAVNGYARKRPPLWGWESWKFLIALRKEEYYTNCGRSLAARMKMRFWRLVRQHYGLALGWDIPANVFGPGLKINHFGLIVVNANARIGAFCDIHQGVNIGQQGTSPDDVPTIGDNAWIGPGAKIFGRITLADGIQIGANAVVNRSFTENDITLAGIPAKKIKDTGNPYKRTAEMFS